MKTMERTAPKARQILPESSVSQSVVDQDGKSQTASAVDARSYPEQHQVQNGGSRRPSHRDIAACAYELWQRRGCPEGSAEEDWLEAQRQLEANVQSREDLRRGREESGSVQP